MPEIAEATDVAAGTAALAYNRYRAHPWQEIPFPFPVASPDSGQSVRAARQWSNVRHR
jgi:hypothetical protein